MDSPMVKATVQSTLLGAFSNTLGQLIRCWQSGSPYSIEIREILIFMAFNILSCPPNFLWQTWLESAFPGYIEKNPTPREKETLDEKVRSTSTATDADSLRSRSRNEERKTPISYSPSSDKKQLSIRNTAIKFLLDQTFGAVFNTVTFLMGIPMLRGQSWQTGWEEVKTGFWPLVFAGQKLWPLVSLISLTLVPVERRMVFGSIIGVGWGIFLSLMAGGKRDKTE